MSWAAQLSKNGKRNQKRQKQEANQLLKVAALVRNRFSVKRAKQKLGKYGQHKSKCGICFDTTLGVQQAVFCHTDGNNSVPHTYCQGCIDTKTTRFTPPKRTKK